MDHSRKPRRRATVLSETFDAEILLYHPERWTGLWLNETASLVWRLCDGERTVAEIIELLENAYPAADDGLALDVERALASLSKDDAIQLE